MYKPGFIALRMKRAGADTGARRHPDDHIRGLTPTIMDLGKVIYDLVEACRHKIGKLHFHHAFKSCQAETQRASDNGTFAQGGVPYPVLAKSLQQSLSYLKGA